MNLDKSRWPRVRFGDVVTLNIDRCADPVAAGIERYVGLEHIEPEDLRIRRWGLVEEGTTFTNRFRPGQVLFGKRRAYQRKVAVADFEGVCSSDIYVFEPKDERLLPELLPFLCQTEAFYEHAVGTSAGSLSPRTNWTQLAGYEFALPPLEEQRRITRVLEAINNQVSEQRSLLISANEMLQATSYALFRELTSTGVPWCKLVDICLQTPQSGIYKSKERYGNGTRMVHMGELFANDCIDQSVQMQRVELTPKEIRRYSLTENDLLFGRRSLVLEGAGRCVRVGELEEAITFESIPSKPMSD
jgi:type I restriction enzyme S subunit